MKQSHLACADWLRERAQHVEHVLDELLPGADIAPTRLHEAMRYAVLGGGKRVRAALVYAAGQACPVNGSTLAVGASMDRAAAAVELIHAYSLVHDDLPCMDDDTLRRGRPTVHVQFDEATAMLAGDALQPLAFELLAGMPIAPALVVQAAQVLARAAGSQGMAGGQAIDLHSVGRMLTRDELQTMHSMKTGAMLACSVTLGGIVAGASSTARQALDSYAQAIGLAFQVVDDILDVTADTASLGKTAGKDAADNKPTYVSLLGLEQARALAQELRQAAHQALAPLGESGARLGQLADFIVLRDR
ncbi:geranyltranstransferase [Bordetella pertussis]|uniref:Farnesyl diphosphate synthase n=3 Tax=Bordetella pertussis TaxID=520 RepID=A0A381A598_BORPT|nr:MULTISPECIES: farnesyl diphosphate synthase [Bordetella]ETH39830.1 polyprenyl synthetase [Bordetella pertussis H918]ETH42244.1 polyprenyl synthetase [Bordetella pertussis H939]ETH46242.1 polyprenyl synthetase [Bordetella pertussis H921]ETH71504.1 polyprenyl synthetase [Bordetella pertussis STO1-CHLA-0011]ETH82427.1 polyprenyl synthetase [Bordetella pertussis STO1-CHOC-0017]ETH85206.1 polyprenyl synthetase [Bordetella pertussis STO1-CHOC-0018]ETH91521.1 polyprenyl synthetase [Bordetella pe